ncbi:HAD family hydrolase [Waterburya agarophytonicola K14]|uniref:HAD family hydrolase n=1 Tax=Waterburya agarophytonicola KI4 TaxID=2874699 RepID=A0A964BMX9_9CYAN|nr:HAD family hydrolase [Waterburya agarophytonicola]MCC0175989.1 HAD family hydrolase [Waterburya agarophytonicola KI4]
MNQLQGLIFDVDGTLANTERDGHRVAFNTAFEEAELDWNWSVELYGELLKVAGGKERVKYFLRQYKPGFVDPQDINQFAAYIHQLKTKYYLELLHNGAITMRRGTIRLIEEARQANIILAIATTTSLPNVIALLEKYLDLDWFEVIAAGDIVAAKKPAPDIYKYVLNKIKILPQNFLVFEDSDNGLIAAKKAGLKTIVTVNNYTKQQDFSQADLVVRDLGEIDQPCQVIQGDFTADYVNISNLKTFFES